MMYNVDFEVEDKENPVRKRALKRVKARIPNYDPIKGAGVAFTLSVITGMAFFISSGFPMGTVSVATFCVALGTAGLVWFFGNSDVRTFKEELEKTEEVIRQEAAAKA